MPQAMAQTRTGEQGEPMQADSGTAAGRRLRSGSSTAGEAGLPDLQQSAGLLGSRHEQGQAAGARRTGMLPPMPNCLRGITLLPQELVTAPAQQESYSVV